jgi:hypothetical protein
MAQKDFISDFPTAREVKYWFKWKWQRQTLQHMNTIQFSKIFESYQNFKKDETTS